MIAISALTPNAKKSTESLYTQVRNLMTDLEAQLNKQPTVNSSQDQKIPQGIRRNDLVISLHKGLLRIGMFDGKTTRYLNANDLQSLQKHNTNFVGLKEDSTAVGAAATRTNHFPNDGDWGFYRETGVSFNLFFNFNGTSQFVAM